MTSVFIVATTCNENVTRVSLMIERMQLGFQGQMPIWPRISESSSTQQLKVTGYSMPDDLCWNMDT